jgi:hypothetical protein
MSKLKIIAVMGLTALVAACATTEEEVVFVEPEPVVAEPVFTGKFR